jgi:uncharacterized membrane protein
MPFYIFAWISDIFYGLCTVFGKLSSKHQLKNPWLLNYIWGLMILVLTIPFAIWFGARWPTHWWPLIILGIFSMLSGTLWVLALNLLDVSILSPFYSVRPVFTAFLGVLFFHEPLTPIQYVLIAIICVAGLFVAVDERTRGKAFFHLATILALFAVLTSAIFGITTKYAMEFEGFWEVTLWGSIFSMIFLLPTVPLFWKDLKKTKVQDYSVMSVAVGTAFIGFLAANKAFAMNVSLSSAIMSVPSSMILAFLFSIFAPKVLEKHTMRVYLIRFGAAAVMVLAALRLSS